MPTNLNALIRYQTIDRCLQNRNIQCTISRLQEECSEALGEKRGVYKKVSERTIRDDIRVLRSDILGFEAPIIFENGCYFYSDPQYSIFKEYMLNKKTVKNIYHLILKNRHNLNNELIVNVLKMLASELNTQLPRAVYRELEVFNKQKINAAKPAFQHTTESSNIDFDSDESRFDDKIRFMRNESPIFTERVVEEPASDYPKKARFFSFKKNDPKHFPWQEIFELLDY